ncbi:hypothetical protein [Stieleria sp.]|uniref:hypothetical protein n=1 Tax=Stieleria sp. TaxID=2795976 RepID=UPI0035680A66
MTSNSPPRFQRRRNGMSLLEVTIGSVMAAMIAMVAAGVTMDMTRNMADNIARTRIAGEARLAIEAFRRDFGGNDPDSPTGDRNRWRLVDSMIPTADELRLCFDSDLDGSADWISPDRVILYFESDGQLIRSDLENGRTNVVAQLVDSVNFEVIGNELRITLAFQLGAITETYVFNTPNI